MKRVLLIASALCIGIAAFVINTNPGITQAQTAANVATGAGPAGSGSVRRRSGRAVYRSLRPRRIEPVGLRGPPHLVQGHRRQRSLPHVHLPAAHRRAGGLVPRAALGPARRPLRGVGHHQRSRLLQARRSGLSRQESRGDLWLRLVSGRRCPAQVCRQAGVRRSGLRAEGCAARSQDTHTKGGTIDQRQSACDLKFGTSTGALGLRKFPNPRFEAQKWKQLNGGTSPTGTASASR